MAIDDNTLYGLTGAQVKDLPDRIKNSFTAGNGISISSGNISAAIYPADFFTAGNTVVGTGSSVTLDKTLGIKIADIQVKGDTRQQAYTGANLYNYADTVNVGSNITVDSEGWITCTYNNSAGSETIYRNYQTAASSLLSTSTDYLIVLEVKSVSGTGALAAVDSQASGQFSSNKTWNFSDVSAGGVYVQSKTTKASFTGCTTMLRSYLRFSVGQSGSITFRISVLADTSVTPETFVYQPFVGGTPAPNPSYPQTIETVTGQQTINVVGKNLLDSSSYMYGYVDSSGSVISAVAHTNALFNYSKVSGGLQYTLSSNTACRMSFAFYDSAKTYISRDAQTSGDGVTSRTTTTPSNCSYIRVWVYRVSEWSQLDIEQANLQLEQGAASTTYRPYQGQEYEVNLGKNLLDITATSTELNQVTFTVNSDGSVTVDGTATANTNFFLNQNISLPNNTYTITGCPTGGSSSSFLMNTRVNGSWGNNDTGNGITVNGTITGVAITVLSGTTMDNVKFYPQVEVGPDATSFSKYFTPIELCKVSSPSTAPSILTYQDYIYKGNDGWYLHKEVDKAVFDGSADENWAAHNVHNGIYAFNWRDAGAAHSNSAILANSYYPVYITTYNSDSLRRYGMIATLESASTSTYSSIFMTAPNNTVTTLAQFTTWLGNNPVTAYFAALTPTDTKITNDALVAQLDALAKAKMVDGTTFISATSADLPAILGITAWRQSLGGVSEAINDVEVELPEIPTVPTITMTTTDPGEGSTLAADNYVAVYGGDPIILDYSTAEVNTGTKWIDGNTIYKKTVSTGTLPNTAEVSIAHGISNLSRVIRLEGYAYSSTLAKTQCLPLVTSDGSNGVSVAVSSSNIVLTGSGDRSAYTESYVTLYYTKSS